MKLIDRYIFRQTISTTIFVAVILCVTVLLVQSLRLIDLIVNRGLPFTDFLFLCLLLLPRLLLYILPVAFFAGTFFVYRRMQGESELTVLKAGGVSSSHLQNPSLMASFVIMLMLYALALYFVPFAHQSLRMTLDQHKAQWSTTLVQEGKFTTVGRDTTLYVRQREGDLLIDFMYDKQGEGAFTVFAEQGQLTNESGRPQVVLFNGSRQSITQGRLQIFSFEQTILDLNIGDASSDNGYIAADERYFHELLSLEKPFELSPQYQREAHAQIHNSLTWPLLAPVFAMIAMVFIFKPSHSRLASFMPIIYASLCTAAIMIGHISIVILAKSAYGIGYALYAWLGISFLMFSMLARGDKKKTNHKHLLQKRERGVA